MKDKPFVIERTYNAPVDKVWKAITDKNDMKQWFFDLAEFKAELGFTFQFEGGPDGGPRYLHVCTITEAIVGKKLSYSWRYEGYDGISFVAFELFPEGDKTRLVLTHVGLETFPADVSDFAAKNFVEGWTHLVGVALKGFLEK